MDFDGIVAKLKAQWPDVQAPPVEVGDRFVIVPTSHNVQILTALRDDPDIETHSVEVDGTDRKAMLLRPKH